VRGKQLVEADVEPLRIPSAYDVGISKSCALEQLASMNLYIPRALAVDFDAGRF
jgi:hypothetical protein